MKRRLLSLPLWAILSASVGLSFAPAAHAGLLSGEDQVAYRIAFTAAHQNLFDDARAAGLKAQDPLLEKVLAWMTYSTANSGASFSDITTFLRQNPSWPMSSTLVRRAEEAITAATPDQSLRDWFDQNPPLTVDGAMAYSRALMATGQPDRAAKIAREAWIAGAFGQMQERQFLTTFDGLLRPEDHNARMDRLLWDRQDAAANTQIGRVTPEYRLLAQARMALSKDTANAEDAFNKVPDALRGDSGLTYDWVRYLRNHDRDAEAMALLGQSMKGRSHPEQWWTERAIMVRKQIQLAHYDVAYGLAADHGQTEGVGFADAEWLAGWISLRFQNNGDVALRHFARIFERVTTPQSRARSAYWAGRACEALNRSEDAGRWYTAAAQNVTTFYGQLAAARIGPDLQWPMPADPLANAEDIDFFEHHELVRAARMLSEIGESEMIRPFMLRMNELAKTPGQRALAAHLATSLGRPDIAVTVARRSERDGFPLISSSYPLPDFQQPDTPERALVLGLIRQESAFNSEAVSPVGARGLMQLMPETASRVAKNAGIQIKNQDALNIALTTDPGLNVQLGSAYLDSLITSFNGSYVLSIAAYNAGPTRVRKWLKDMGDPRTPDVDVVDWMESIPYPETRNYVQRVLEGVQIYRRRLGATDLARSLDTDLKR